MYYINKHSPQCVINKTSTSLLHLFIISSFLPSVLEARVNSTSNSFSASTVNSASNNSLSSYPYMYKDYAYNFTDADYNSVTNLTSSKLPAWKLQLAESYRILSQVTISINQSEVDVCCFVNRIIGDNRRP